MTDATGTPAGDIAAPADTSELSLEDARKLIFAEPEIPADGAEEATAEPESSKEDAAPEKDPSEDAPEADPQEAEPIEPPRSWTKAEKERFQSLPRETQEYLHTREQERERDFRRSQNEIAEQRKAIETEREQAKQARQEYETKTKSALEVLEREQLRDFADIRTMADVEKMALEDPFRKIQWDVHQQKMQAVAWEAQQAKTREAQEHQTNWADLVQKENAKAAELIPDLADKDKAPALMKRAAERLADLGFNPEELNDLASGKSRLPVYDHRIQQLIFDSLKLADIQNAPKAVAAKPLPTVQRPGVARAAGSGDSEKIQALENRLNQTGSIKDAEALMNARLAASSRRRAS